MATKRSYHDRCATAHALELIGERWALLVVRELVLGPKRFTDLRHGLPGISPNVLTQRLTELEETAIVRRRKLPPPASAWIYELTDWGAELEPVIMAVGRWAARSPNMRRDAGFGVDSAMLSFRTMFSTDAAGDLDATFELRLGEHRFKAEVREGALSLTRGEADRPDAVVETDSNTLAGMAYGGFPLEAAIATGAVKLVGDPVAFARFMRCFPLPPTAEGPVTQAAAAGLAVSITDE